MKVAALRSMYELPCVVQFITLNKEKFGFPSIDTEVSMQCDATQWE